MTDQEVEQALETLAGRAKLLATLPPVEEREKLRRRLGVTSIELAKLVGTNRGTLRRIEQGTAIPKGRVLLALAKFYAAAQQGSVQHVVA
jgi:predicted transcriptional regulator